jgi:hypothetical protein
MDFALVEIVHMHHGLVMVVHMDLFVLAWIVILTDLMFNLDWSPLRIVQSLVWLMI